VPELGRGQSSSRAGKTGCPGGLARLGDAELGVLDVEGVAVASRAQEARGVLARKAVQRLRVHGPGSRWQNAGVR